MIMSTKTEVTIKMSGAEATQLAHYLHISGVGNNDETPMGELLYQLQNLPDEVETVVEP
jgi:hypothetical protein